MSKLNSLYTLLENAEYDYNRRCKKTGYKYVPFRTMMKCYTIALFIIIGVVLWVW